MAFLEVLFLDRGYTVSAADARFDDANFDLNLPAGCKRHTSAPKIRSSAVQRRDTPKVNSIVARFVLLKPSLLIKGGPADCQ